MTPHFELLTPRLLLRPLIETDRETYIDFIDRNHDHFAPYSATPPPGSTLDDRFKLQLQRTRQGLEGGLAYRFFAFLRQDNQMAGFFHLMEIVRNAFQCSYAAWGIGHNLTRKGLATEGVLGLLDFAFSPGGAGLHRVQANVIPTNVPSNAVARRCGFRHEGLALRYLHIAGQWQDHNMYAKTAEEHACAYLTGLY